MSPPARAAWLNRNVIGMGVTSLLSDAGHEMATAVLPGFLTVIGAPAAALGAIEGVSDAVSSFVKLGAGWYSDRLGHRKGITVAGYLLTGLATGLFALAVVWPIVLVARTIAWFGRGIRGPLRDAMLADSVEAAQRGKAFGFHRAGDTLGAVIGPLLAVGVLSVLSHHSLASPAAPFRYVFLLTLIPGVGAAVTFALLVTERRRAAQPAMRFWATLRALPRPYFRLLAGVGLFGMGDFAPTFLILAATLLLAPAFGVARAAEFAALLYVLRNVTYAGASYPIGALSDRLGRRRLLAAGYAVGALVAIAFGAAFALRITSGGYLALLFALAGVYIAAEDALEGAITADFVESATRGTGYGVMAAVNGAGDLSASLVVGVLWSAVGPAVAFAYAAALMVAGAVLLLTLR